jgi:hypothetical protein
MIRDVHYGPWIRILIFYPSRLQGSKRHRIRISNTGSRGLPVLAEGENWGSSHLQSKVMSGVSFKSIIMLLCTVCYFPGRCHEGWLALACVCCIETFYRTEHPDSVPCHGVNCVRICQTFTMEKKEFLHLVKNRTAAFYQST